MKGAVAKRSEVGATTIPEAHDSVWTITFLFVSAAIDMTFAKKIEKTRIWCCTFSHTGLWHTKLINMQVNLKCIFTSIRLASYR